MDPVIVVATRSKNVPPPLGQHRPVDGPINWVCGNSDVTLARNMQLSLGLRLAHAQKKKTVVLLDDDIRISVPQLELLCAACSPGQPSTLLYCCRGEQDRLPVTYFDDLVASGLGACAVAVSDLEKVTQYVPRDIERNMSLFTESTMHLVDGSWTWLSEDYCFWRALKLYAKAELLVLNERAIHLSDSGDPLLPFEDAAGARVNRRVLP